MNLISRASTSPLLIVSTAFDLFIPYLDSEFNKKIWNKKENFLLKINLNYSVIWVKESKIKQSHEKDGEIKVMFIIASEIAQGIKALDV